MPRTFSPEDRVRRAEQQRQHEELKRAIFLEEYEHFRGFGWPDEQIAERFGIQLNSLQVRLRRMGVPLRIPLEERRFDAMLQKLIDRGEPFTAASLPMGVDDNTLRAKMRQAKKDGRIAQIGSQRVFDGVIAVWLGTHALDVDIPTTEEKIA